MPEQEYEVMVTDTEYLCDECREPVRATAVVPMNDSLMHSHVCRNGHEIRLKEHYPLRRYWRVDG